MYFPDMHVGPHWFKKGPEQYIYVGWLAQPRSFAIGNVESTFCDAIRSLCLNPENRTRGFHICEFCPRLATADAIGKAFETRQRGLGSAEIHVPASDGSIFLCPNLIYHYIEAHKYLPPSPFLEGVKQSCK